MTHAETPVSVTTNKGPHGHVAEATAVRRVDLDALWAVVVDYDRYTEFMPRTVESRVVSRESETSLVFQTALGFTLKKIRYSLRMTLDREAGKITWTQVEGILKRNDGGWVFEDLGEGFTRITYSTLVDVGFRVPKAIVKSLIGSSLPEVIEAAVRRARTR